MNSEKYEDLLQKRMVDHYDSINSQEKRFMHDGAPPHKSKRIHRFLESKNINMLDWPRNFTDLNPIEHILAYLKRKLIYKRSSSKEDLIRNVKMIWENEIPKEFIENLALSMPNRIKSLIENNGGDTSY